MPIQVPTHYLQQLAKLLAEMGVDVDAWLAKHRLSRQALVDAEGHLCWSDFASLLHQAQQQVAEPCLGLLLGQRLRLSHHGALGLALYNCHTLDELLVVAKDFIATRSPLIELDYQVNTQGNVSIFFTPKYSLEPITAFYFETLLSSIYLGISTLFDRDDFLLELSLPHSLSKHLHHYQAFFACKVNFAGDNGTLLLDKSLLGNTRPDADEHTLAQAKQICTQELAQSSLDAETSWAQRCLRLLQASAPNFLTLIQCADSLGCSQRTLHRHLEKENCHFQQCLDKVKHQLAIQYLQQGKSVTTTAFELGYGDVANFRRAFRRWQGTSPSEYKVKQPC